MRGRMRCTGDLLRRASLVLLTVSSSLALAANAAMQARTKPGPGSARCVADEPEAVHAKRKVHRRYKVLFQVNEADPAKWRMALANIRNVQSEIGRKNLDIELVVYGPGINMLKFDSEAAAGVTDAIDGGVRVVACDNTMKGMGLSDDDLVPNVRYVKAGVVEIIERQAQGYQYVRP